MMMMINNRRNATTTNTTTIQSVLRNDGIECHPKQQPPPQSQLPQPHLRCHRLNYHHLSTKKNVRIHYYYYFYYICCIGLMIAFFLIVSIFMTAIVDPQQQRDWKNQQLQQQQPSKEEILHNNNSTVDHPMMDDHSNNNNNNHGIEQQKQQRPWSLLSSIIFSTLQHNFIFTPSANEWNMNPHLWSNQECRQRKNQRTTQQQQQQQQQRIDYNNNNNNRLSNAYSKTKKEIQPASPTLPPITSTTTIDIISTGSNTKINYITTQQYRTFGRHSSIRYFFPITESNDTDTKCFQHLSQQQYDAIIQFCTVSSSSVSKPKSSLFWSSSDDDDYTAYELRTKLFGPKGSKSGSTNNNHTRTTIGWLCAQQRPIDGIRIAIEQFRRNVEQLNSNNNINNNTTTAAVTIYDVLPDYLLLIDDDTYVHMDVLIETLRTHYSPEQVYVLAGCVYHKPMRYFAFPWGGFGTILTRAALQRFVQPIDCSLIHKNNSNRNNESNPIDDDIALYTQYVCWRIHEHNYINETLFFTNGMSVADLMIYYMQQQSFTNIQDWYYNTYGYCFHSDHILAYFLNFYFISVTSVATTTTGREDLPPFPSSTTNDNSVYHFMEQLRKSNPILSIDPCQGTECSHVGYDKCRLVSPVSNVNDHHQQQPHLCHNIDPEDMIKLYQQEQLEKEKV